MLRAVGAVDVHYGDHGGARAAPIVCQDLTFSTVVSECVADIARTAPYEPGAFYKRELRCIETVLAVAPALNCSSSMATPPSTRRAVSDSEHTLQGP